MTSLLCPGRIAAGLNRQAKKIAIEIVDETGSTNTDLLKRAHTLSSPTLLLALRQTTGRGRNGKPWLSRQGTSLTFSLAWCFLRSAAELSGLSLAVGVSLAKALRRLGIPVMLKWPNDILQDGKKLAGILIERPSDANRPKTRENWVIIGIGINLQLPDELEAQIGQPAAEALRLANMDKNRLMAALLNNLADSLTLFDRHGLPAFMQAWHELHAHHGKKVFLFQNGRPEQTGIVIGIDEYGRLILEENGNRTAFSAGDISLRLFDEQAG